MYGQLSRWAHTGFSQWKLRAKSAQKFAGSWMDRLYSASYSSLLFTPVRAW